MDHLQVPLDPPTILPTKGIRPRRRRTNQFITILKKGLAIIARKYDTIMSVGNFLQIEKYKKN
jgi:hypothetical protein